jgi:hypothetical protein
MARTCWAVPILSLIAFQASITLLRADQASSESVPRPIAQVKERIDTDRLEIHLYQGKKPVRLAPFMELFVITPLSKRPGVIENLTNRSVAIVQSDRKPDRWEVYQDVWGCEGKRGSLPLADNVFKVKQVFISSPQNPIELRLDEKVVQIKPGDALLVL